MRINIDRKKLLCVSFFLCCILPACFTWFSCGEQRYSGTELINFFFLLGIAVYAFALLFDRLRHVLAFGILGHCLLVPAYLLSWLRAKDLALAGAAGQAAELAVQPPFYVACALLLAHLALFTTTELAFQRLSVRKDDDGKRG